MAVYFFKRSAFIFFSNFKYAFLKVNYTSQFGRKVLLIDFGRNLLSIQWAGGTFKEKTHQGHLVFDCLFGPFIITLMNE